MNRRLVNRRLELGLSNYAIALKAGISPRSVEAAMAGRRIQVAKAALILRALDLDPERDLDRFFAFVSPSKVEPAPGAFEAVGA